MKSLDAGAFFNNDYITKRPKYPVLHVCYSLQSVIYYIVALSRSISACVFKWEIVEFWLYASCLLESNMVTSSEIQLLINIRITRQIQIIRKSMKYFAVVRVIITKLTLYQYCNMLCLEKNKIPSENKKWIKKFTLSKSSVQNNRTRMSAHIMLLLYSWQFKQMEIFFWNDVTLGLKAKRIRNWASILC